MLILALATMVAPLAATQVETAAAAPVPEVKRICKRTVETGSIAKRRKECRTVAEWDRIAESARANGRAMTDQNAAMSTNGM